MTNRRPLTSQTVRSVSEEIAGNPLSEERAAAGAEGMEPILQLIDGLRAVPLKEVEPAVIFHPERGQKDD